MLFHFHLHSVYMDSDSAKETIIDWPGYIRVYKDGSADKLVCFPSVSPSLKDPETGVASKDVIISSGTGLSARLYHPKSPENYSRSPTHEKLKLPMLVYFHGGGFYLGSAFYSHTHRYLNIIASLAQVLIISVEYRLAPEHLLPAAYEDGWTALNWAASRSDPWLADHGDLESVFIGGDSAGGNLAHNIAMRAGAEGLDHGVKLLGAFLSCPYFLVPKEEVALEIVPGSFLEMGYKTWNLVHPNAPGGFDNPMINPMGSNYSSLAGLGCARVLVVVASEDSLKDVGVRYYDAVKKIGFKGSLEFFEGEGDHCFYLHSLEDKRSMLVMQRHASFLHK